MPTDSWGYWPLLFLVLSEEALRRVRSLIESQNLATHGVWVDAVHDEIVVVAGGATPKVLAFDRQATGLVVPKRTITGPNTMLDHPSQVAVDATNDEIVVANLGDRAVDPPVQGSITVYNRTDDGDVAPKRFIQGPNSGVGFPRAVWVDPLHNEIGEGDSKFNWIQVFPRLFEAWAAGR